MTEHWAENSRNTCSSNPFNSTEIAGPKEKAKEDNSAPVSRVTKECGRDRNATDWDSLDWTEHKKSTEQGLILDCLTAVGRVI